jgi:hypothetical protein
MAQIQPVIFPILGTATNMVVEVLQTNMEASSATFYYKLTDGDGNMIPDTGNTIVEGNIAMTEVEYDAWGADNEYVIQWAANKLGLTLL